MQILILNGIINCLHGFQALRHQCWHEEKSNLLFLMLGPVNQGEAEQSWFSLPSALLFAGMSGAGGSLLGMALPEGSSQCQVATMAHLADNAGRTLCLWVTVPCCLPL